MAEEYWLWSVNGARERGVPRCRRGCLVGVISLPEWVISFANQPILAHRVVNFDVSIGRQDTGCQIQLTHTIQRTVPKHGTVV